MEKGEIHGSGADFVDGLILGDRLERAPIWRADEDDDAGCPTNGEHTCVPDDDEDEDDDDGCPTNGEHTCPPEEDEDEDD